jgi:iron(III) transport system substrate-binding protein
MHTAALSVTWGDAATKAFFEQLKANGVRIASSNGEVKRLVTSGEVIFGLTDTDDANEALRDGAPVDIVFPDADGAGTLVMPTAVVLMKNGPHGESARKLIDYLLSPSVEQQMALAAAHLPLRASIAPPRGFKGVSDIAAMPVDYGQLATEVERIQPWLRTWVGL